MFDTVPSPEESFEPSGTEDIEDTVSGSSDDTFQPVSLDDSSLSDAYCEQVVEQLTVMNEYISKIYICNLFLIGLMIFFFVYMLIKNNITRHFV